MSRLLDAKLLSRFFRAPAFLTIAILFQGTGAAANDENLACLKATEIGRPGQIFAVPRGREPRTLCTVTCAPSADGPNAQTKKAVAGFSAEVIRRLPHDGRRLDRPKTVANIRSRVHPGTQYDPDHDQSLCIYHELRLYKGENLVSLAIWRKLAVFVEPDAAPGPGTAAAALALLHRYKFNVATTRAEATHIVKIRSEFDPGYVDGMKLTITGSITDDQGNFLAPIRSDLKNVYGFATDAEEKRRLVQVYFRFGEFSNGDFLDALRAFDF